nr:immunoglobulin heavy chain junction region [Macaca mulatta]MOX59135.1 immunoglobulin heavy chain junction region [Macaca mulatta]MOX63768.1 immunoglobulin heavy chain junction region [Macaca mulatta]MOX65996.1 immunoglobulin heavy chain junction region [Macaca mulatta]MOX66424.1 immunoglobulin heavy chain junction region [Macaca mulatta]
CARYGDDDYSGNDYFFDFW